MWPTCWHLLLLLLCGLMRHGCATVDASKGSYVIALHHQAAGQQPYPRGANSKAMSFFIGRGERAVPYTFTVNTGSAVLMMTCRSAASRANCGNLPPKENYVLKNEQAVSNSTTCTETGIGCVLPSNGKCFVSAPQLAVSPDTDRIHNGVIAQDTITVRNVLLGSYITFPGKFGCAHSAKLCTSQSCYDVVTKCPATSAAVAPVLKGECPGSGKGIESGWSFVADEGSEMSALPVPQQMLKAGLIKNKVMGFCFQQPQKDVYCSARSRPNSVATLGPILPTDIKSTAQLYSAPLYSTTSPKEAAEGTAIPRGNIFRSTVVNVTVPVYIKPNANDTPWSTAFVDRNVSALWDVGAHGRAMVPAEVYAAFVQYWQQGKAAALASKVLRDNGFVIEKCPSVSEVCGENVPDAEHACWQISMRNFPGEATREMLYRAKTLLLSMYPEPINISLQGGAVVQLPTVFDVNLCTGFDYTYTEGVAVCSYVQSAPENDPSSWLAAPWFTGRFVQFDLDGPATKHPDSAGTIRWSDLLYSSVF